MTNSDLITLKDPRSSVADAYRTLRTNLMFSQLDRPLVTIGITAPALDDDKGKVAANLAITMAQVGKKTILVDADLRLPSQHQLWGKPTTPGLTTALLSDNLDVHLHDTAVDNLHLLTAGELPANPVDVLASARMDQLITKLKTLADIIIWDMPPVLVAADASVLGQKLDGILLVIKANRTRRDHTSRAKAQLERVNARLLGATLIDAPTDRASAKYR
jgi:non-specific protein-tyrosine kinase